MVQWLRAVAVFLAFGGYFWEDQSSVPNTRVSRLTIACNSSSTGTCTHVQILAHKQILIHITKNKINLGKKDKHV